jgi:DHA1 family tetracycline resistance protein-like MFS transporter
LSFSGAAETFIEEALMGARVPVRCHNPHIKSKDNLQASPPTRHTASVAGTYWTKGDGMTPPMARKGALVFVFIAVLIDSVGFGIVLPVFPQLIMDLTGVRVARAAEYGGWLAFVYSLMQFFCAPILGNLSDRFGRRPVLLFALLALGVDYLIMGCAPVISWLFIGRAISGIAGASWTPAYAYIADITPAEKRAQNFGLMGAAFGIGFIVGPAIGGLLGEFGPRAPFIAAGAIALANTALGFFALPESLPQHSRRPFVWSRANPLGTINQIRRYPSLPWMIGSLFLWQLGHQVLPTTWAFYTIAKFNWKPAEVGSSLAFVGVLMALAQGVLTRWLIPRLGGERSAAGLGLIVAFFTFIGYGLATNGWMMYAVSTATLFVALAYPAMNALMSQQIPADAQGELQGAVASASSLSSIIGPPFMTEIFSYFSGPAAPIHFPGAAFLAAAGLTAASGALYMKTIRISGVPVSGPVQGQAG